MAVRSLKLLLHALLLLLLLLLAKASAMLPAPVFVKEGGREERDEGTFLHARPISSSSESGPAKSLTTRVLASNSPRPPHYQPTEMCHSSACLACVWDACAMGFVV